MNTGKISSKAQSIFKAKPHVYVIAFVLFSALNVLVNLIQLEWHLQLMIHFILQLLSSIYFSLLSMSINRNRMNEADFFPSIFKLCHLLYNKSLFIFKLICLQVIVFFGIYSSTTTYLSVEITRQNIMNLVTITEKLTEHIINYEQFDAISKEWFLILFAIFIICVLHYFSQTYLQLTKILIVESFQKQQEGHERIDDFLEYCVWGSIKRMRKWEYFSACIRLSLRNILWMFFSEKIHSIKKYTCYTVLYDCILEEEEQINMIKKQKIKQKQWKSQGENNIYKQQDQNTQSKKNQINFELKSNSLEEKEEKFKQKEEQYQNQQDQQNKLFDQEEIQKSIKQRNGQKTANLFEKQKMKHTKPVRLVYSPSLNRIFAKKQKIL